ncbi:hypothetical protein B5F40_09435 [Gordonibacter sp. An230]|nr:hypothetical protein B5F40_09435 [Gordonibacter sp. An230]
MRWGTEPVREDPSRYQSMAMHQPFEVGPYRIRCPRCGSAVVNVQVVSEVERRGCLSSCLMVLLALTIIGIPLMILWIVLRGEKTRTRNCAVCQSCGCSWDVP